MNIIEFFEKIKNIQIKLNEFLENDEDVEENYQNYIKIISDEKIFDNIDKFKLNLQLLSNIIENHHRTIDLIKKIQKILLFMKAEIKQTFSNYEIFDFFKNCKIILLFLINENIIAINKSVVDVIISEKFKNQKYPEYFYKEIKPYLEKYNIESIKSDEYEKNRENGENEKHLYKLIREDSIGEFITYVNKNDFFLQSIIEPSIFETNSFLLKKNPTLIEYSAFYGSISIFKYLYLNGAKIDPTSIWLYSIHGNNPELISFLEENKIEPEDESYQKCLEESIKCHHNDLTNYILANFIKEENESKFKRNKFSYAFHYHNYLYLPTDPNNSFIFYYACQYNYINIVNYFLQNKLINVNKSIIRNHSF